MGLPHGSPLDDVKKRFRELALKYHPDVNDDPEAKEKFLNYLKAYQYLLNEGDQLADMYSSYKQKSYQERPVADAVDEFEARQKAREKMRQRAREYAEAHKKEAEEIEKRVFTKLTSGWPWNLVRLSAAISCIFALAIFVDFWLPEIQTGTTVKAKVYYKYFQRNTVIYDDQSTVDVPENVHLRIASGDTFLLNFSGMLQEFTSYTIIKPSGEEMKFDNPYNLFSYYPIASLLFLIPGFLFYYKKNEVSFYILYFAVCVPYPGLIIHQILREDKLTHVLSWLSS